MLKKTIRRLGALAMVLAMAVSVFAVNASATNNGLAKEYTKAGSATVTPAEELSFHVDDWSAADYSNTDYANKNAIPHNVSVTKVAGASNFTIATPTLEGIGTFTYKMVEDDAGTAGVTYGATFNLVIQRTWADKVIKEEVYLNDGTNKIDTISNTFSAGTLNVSKTVTGAMGDKTKYFDFIITLTAPEGKTVRNAITYGDQTIEAGWSGEKEVSISLKDGETATFNNIPYGVKYTVVETAVDGYETTKTGDNGTIDSATATAAFTNKKDATTPTGVIMTIAPYALMVVLAGAFAVVFLTRRNRAE